MINRKEIKAAARMRMAQSEPSFWKVMLVWVAIAVIVPMVLDLLVGSPIDRFYTLVANGIDPQIAVQVFQGSASMVSIFLDVVLFLLQLVLSFGLTHYALRLYQGESSGVPDLFTGFSMVGRVLGMQLLIGVFSFLWMLLMMIPIAVLIGLMAVFVQSTAALIAVGVVLYLLLLVGVIAIVLRYAMATLALADQPELSAMEAIRRSKELMRGNKGEYVLFVLSFLGWMVLCSILTAVLTAVAAVGDLFLPEVLFVVLSAVAMLPIYLWLSPYMEIATAGFYQALKGTRSRPEMPPL